MFSFLTSLNKKDSAEARVFLTNTLTRKKELFVPLVSGIVRMYSCGPTVYGRQHLGNLRSALFSDTMHRALSLAGFKVQRVINITDVGHMVGDGDAGEDKMAVGAAREQLTPEQVAKKYADIYFDDLSALNVDLSTITFPFATQYISEQIEMIKKLEEKGLTYKLRDGLYFDTGKFPKYGILGDVQKIRLIGGARVKPDAGKHNLHDFALWRLAKHNDLQQWDSPWGRGNPGWHIECSAMIEKLLGETIDIHTGGEDHIMVHHNNEIAQSEGAHGKTFARYFVHNAFQTNNSEKISKSLGNEMYLSNIIETGLHPLAFRLFCLQAHYSKPLSYSIEAIAASNEALLSLWKDCQALKEESKQKTVSTNAIALFNAMLFDDLATPKALAFLFTSLQSEDYSAKEKWSLIVHAETAFGLMLTNPPEDEEVVALSLSDLSGQARELGEAREEARSARDYALSDELRQKLLMCGYTVEDTARGTLYTKVHK